MKKADIVKALNGYKAGTLNKYKKGALMKNFAKSLTTAQIKSIANSWGK
jgi:cytochrome c553